MVSNKIKIIESDAQYHQSLMQYFAAKENSPEQKAFLEVLKAKVSILQNYIEKLK